MKKTLFLFIFFLTFIVTPLHAQENSAGSNFQGINWNERPAKVAVFMMIDSYGIAEPDMVLETIYNNIKDKITPLGNVVIPREDSRSIIREYVREHRIMELSKSDLKNLAKESGADFSLFISARQTDSKVKGGLFSTSIQHTVSCEIRMIGVDDDKYRVDNTFADKGKSTAGVYGGLPSSDRAYVRALDGALEDINFTTDMFSLSE